MAGYRPITAALVVLVGLATSGCATSSRPGARATTGSSPSAAPSPPPIPAGTASILKPDNGFDPHQLRISTTTDLKSDQAYVKTPHFNIGLDVVQATTALDQQQINALGMNSARSGPAVHAPLTADAGHEFLITHTTGGPRGMADSQPGAKPQLAIRVGDKSSFVAAGDLEWSRVIVTQLPAGSDAFLVVTDAGRTLSISLRTGKRGEATPSYTALSGSVELPTLLQVDRYRQVGIQTKIYCSLLPYAEGHGWAAPGHAWLVVHLDADVIGSDIDLHLSVPGSFELRRSDGQALALPAGTLDTAGTGPLGSATIETVLDIPDNACSLRYAIRLSMTVTASSAHAKLSWRPVGGRSSASGTITLG